MLTNEKILEIIKNSFLSYLTVGTSRSTAKLKALHGHIAYDLQKRLGDDFLIKSQGYGDDKEGNIEGRYYPKNVDITIYYKNQPVAGFGIKFVMRNYSQNSNNYFENMLGETANLRANEIPYFQIFIIFDKVPYYKKGGEFCKYETISTHHLGKYLRLSFDDPEVSFHTPDKTLMVLLSLKEKSPNYKFLTEKEYAEYYHSVISDEDLITYSEKVEDNFGNSVILNDYEDFISKSVYIILEKLKR